MPDYNDDNLLTQLPGKQGQDQGGWDIMPHGAGMTLATILGLYNPVQAAQNALSLATQKDAYDEQRIRNRVEYTQLKEAGLLGGGGGTGMGAGGAAGGGAGMPAIPQLDMPPEASAQPAIPQLGGQAPRNYAANPLHPSSAYPQVQAQAVQAATAAGIDPDLGLALAQVESDFNPMAVSPKGAKGVMQLMPGTAQGLHVSDPFNVAQNVPGGMQYFAGLLRQFHNDPVAALAAYNAGPETVKRVMRQYGPQWKDALPAETKLHIARVMSLYQQRKIAAAAKGQVQQPGQLQAPPQPNRLAPDTSMMTAQAAPTTMSDAPMFPTGQPTQVAQAGGMGGGMGGAVGQPQPQPQPEPPPPTSGPEWSRNIPMRPGATVNPTAMAMVPQIAAKVKMDQYVQDSWAYDFMKQQVQPAIARFNKSGSNAAKNKWIDTVAAPALFDPRTGQLKDPRTAEAARQLVALRNADVSGDADEYTIKGRITPSYFSAAQSFNQPKPVLDFIQQHMGEEAKGVKFKGGKLVEMDMKSADEAKAEKFGPNAGPWGVTSEGHLIVPDPKSGTLIDDATKKPWTPDMGMMSRPGATPPMMWQGGQAAMAAKSGEVASPMDILNGMVSGQTAMGKGARAGQMQAVVDVFTPIAKIQGQMLVNGELSTAEIPNAFGIPMKSLAVGEAKMIDPKYNASVMDAKVHAMGRTLDYSEKTLVQALSYAEMTERNAWVASYLSGKSDRTTSPLVNKWLVNKWKSEVTGDEDLRAFNSALYTFVSDYARATTTLTGAGGATTDSARNDQMEKLNTCDNEAAFKHVMDQMHQDLMNKAISMGNAVDATLKFWKDPAGMATLMVGRLGGQGVSEATMPGGRKIISIDGGNKYYYEDTAEEVR
jgi:hypothetical protein